MKKLIQLILLFVIFLSTIQIAQGQKYYAIIPSTDKTCIPNTLLDSMIHDVMVGKQLKVKDSLSTAQILKQQAQLALINDKLNKAEKSFLISENKRQRNGWQRNILIIISVVLGGMIIR